MIIMSTNPKPAYVPNEKGGYIKLNKCTSVRVSYTTRRSIHSSGEIIEANIKLTGEEMETVAGLPFESLEQLTQPKPLNLSDYSIIELLEEVQGRI